jgi:hypothetical protein
MDRFVCMKRLWKYASVEDKSMKYVENSVENNRKYSNSERTAVAMAFEMKNKEAQPTAQF